MMNNFKTAKIFLIFAFLLFGCTAVHPLRIPDQYEQPWVRVAILDNAQQFLLEIQGPYRISDLKTKNQIDQGLSLKPSNVWLDSEGIRIQDTLYLSNQIQITPGRDGSIYMNNRRLRGLIHVARQTSGHFLVVNILRLEDYLRGVLYHEVSDRWPMEAIKAQAVAARTYALYSMQNSRHRPYDVTDDIYSQVYGGYASEKYRTNLAVERTFGLVLSYQNKILPSYYHATCAGHTENASELWRYDLPVLRGVKCIFCQESPHYQWKRNIQLRDIQDKLNAQGYDLWLIRDIEVIERNQSGRVRMLKITTRDDQEIMISGKDFRNIVGPNMIRSNNFQIDMKGYFVDFLGKGWGHGVGLCQWGAYFMSQRGYPFDEILQHYYPKAHIIHYQNLNIYESYYASD